MTQDTEARRLAQHGLELRGAGMFPNSADAKVYFSHTADNFHIVARAYLDLLTRLETPGLTADKVSFISEGCPHVFYDSMYGRESKISCTLRVCHCMTVADRLTQPTSTVASCDHKWVVTDARDDFTDLKCLRCGSVMKMAGHPSPLATVTTAPAVDGGGDG